MQNSIGAIRKPLYNQLTKFPDTVDSTPSPIKPMSLTTIPPTFCIVTAIPLNMSYPPTLMHPNSKPLRHKTSTTSSLWALDAEDYERLARQLELIPPPPHIHLPFRQSHTLFHQPYNIGDPFFVEDSLEPYIFQGFTGKVSYSPKGEMMQEAAFAPLMGCHPMTMSLYNSILHQPSLESNLLVTFHFGVDFEIGLR